MDNDKLLRMIGITLGTLAGKIDTALAGVSDDRLKCNSGSCPHYAGSGRCTATDKCVLATVEGDACRERCINNKCEFRDDDDTCLGLTVCVDQIAPDAPDVPVEELLQGYTLAQWDEIRKGRYLCEVAPGPGCGGNHTLRTISAIDGDLSVPFTDEKGLLWAYCRPARIPGVLRPWFGGDRPVDKSTMVVVKWSDGDVELSKAINFDWCHDELENIIAYMEV